MKVGAIELGGTHVSAAAVDLDARRVEGSGRAGFAPDAPLDALLAAFEDAAAALRGVRAVAVAAPGPFDYERGVCTIAGLGKLDALYGVDLRSVLARMLGLATTSLAFLNDAEAFALGEAWAGAAQGCERAIAVTLGTGFGAAFLRAGHVVRDGAGVPPDGVFFPLRHHGAPVEDRISRRGILAAYGPAPGVDVVDVAGRARAGEERALAVFRELGADLAAFLAPWVRSFAADRVVFGGSITRAWELFAEPLSALGPGVAVPAARPDDAALLGAARYVGS